MIINLYHFHGIGSEQKKRAVDVDQAFMAMETKFLFWEAYGLMSILFHALGIIDQVFSQYHLKMSMICTYKITIKMKRNDFVKCMPFWYAE